MEQLIRLKESLICNICQKKFDRVRDLKLHLFNHDTLSCDVCEKVFSHPKNLKRHYRVHTGEKPYECEVCLKRYASPAGFNRHCLTHSGKRNYACNKCSRLFFFKHDLKKHQETHANKKGFNCSECLKSFASLDKLNKHLSSHGTEKPFKCNMCPRKFVYKQSLVRHYPTHLVKCDKCKSVFYSEQELKQHKLVHCGKTFKSKIVIQKKLSDLKSLKDRNLICKENGIYKCKECKKAYEHRKNFLRHLLIHEEKKFACDVCNIKFFRKDHLQRHYTGKRHHTMEKTQKPLKYSQKLYKFKNLNTHKLVHSKGKGSVSKKNEERLDSQSDFINSVDYSSIEKSPAPYVVLERLELCDYEKSVQDEKTNTCGVCSRKFSKKSNLKRHSLIHTRGEKRISEECEASFDSQSDLQNYYSSVRNSSITDASLEKSFKSKNSINKTKKKSYDCKKTKKKYSYQPNLRKYLRKHVIGKFYTCDVCDKVFHRQDIFENHCLSHSGVKPYECKDCDKKFMYKSNLTQHMIFHKPQKPVASFVCEICMKVFIRGYDLRRHAKLHTSNNCYMCDICQLIFPDAKRLKRHCDKYKGKQIYECKDCAKIFHLPRSLNNHLLSHKMGYLQCGKCLKKFANQQSLQSHLNLFCGTTPLFGIGDKFSDKSNQNKKLITAALEKLTETDDKDNNNNFCNICQRAFPNAKLFKYHMDTYKRKQTYECPHCVKKFHRRTSLNNHILIHNRKPSEQHVESEESQLDEQRNPCITNIEPQSEIHSENNNNICNVCLKSFADSRLFKYHLDTYKGRKTYECPKCPKKFHEGGSLRKHLVIHKMKGSQCDVCLKVFDDPVSLEQHIHIISGQTSYEGNIEDIFRGESLKNLISRGISVTKEPNPCTTENPHVIYIGKEIQK